MDEMEDRTTRAQRTADHHTGNPERGAGILLDRSRLLGFDQVEARDARSSQLAKVGGKPAVDPRIGGRIGGKIGAKAGIKQTDRSR